MFCSMDLSLLTILLAAKYVRIITMRSLVFRGTNITSKLVLNNDTYEFMESFTQFSYIAIEPTSESFQGVLRTCVIVFVRRPHGTLSLLRNPLG